MRACSLAAILLAATSASAGDEPDARTLTITEVRQLKAISDDAWGTAYALIGPLQVNFGGVFRVRARRCVVWLDPKVGTRIFDLITDMRGKERRIPIWAVRAIYAEGGRAPALFHSAGRVFRCASLFFDLQKHRGVLVGPEFRLRRRGEFAEELPDLAVRAKRLIARGPGKWDAELAEVFSTDYVDPEIAVEVDRIELRNPSVTKILGKLVRLSEAGREAGEGVAAAEIDEVLAELTQSALNDRDTRVDFHSITARVLGVPVMGWKHLHADESTAAGLRVEAEAGDRGRLSTGAWLGVGLRGKPISFLIGGGYFHDRGPLVDLDVEVDAFGSLLTGRSRSSYLRDHDPSQPSENRFWTQNQYRLKLTDKWRLDGELALLSDANWLLTYDERIFKEGKRQESLLHLKRRGDYGSISIVGKTRTISFLREVEELPRVSASLPTWTLFRTGKITAQVATTAELGNLRVRSPKGSGLPEFRTVRFDVDPTFSLAFQLGAIRIVPYVTTRFTAYDDTLAGGSLSRLAASGGVRADVQLWRWYGNTRHVMNFSFEYTDMFSVSESASSLFPIDTIDTVTPYEVLSLRFRNRFQKTTDSGVATFLTFEIFGAWFPDGQQPYGRTGDGYIDFSLAWWRGDQVGIGLHADINPELGELSAGAIEGWWQAYHNLRLGAGLRHLEDDSDIVTLTLATDVDTRWRITLFSQFDIKNSDSLDQGLFVQRLGKTAVIGVRLTFDPGDGDFGIGFSVDLLEAFRKGRARDDNEIRLSEFTAR